MNAVELILEKAKRIIVSDWFEANQWDRAYSVLIKLGDLKNNWDGEGSKEPSFNLRWSASKLFHKLVKSKAAVPINITSLSDGNVYIIWKTKDNRSLDLEVTSERIGEVIIHGSKEPAEFYDVTW